MNWDEIGYGIGNQFNVQGNKQYDQEQANQAIASSIMPVIEQLMSQGTIPGTEGLQMNPYAEQERNVGLNAVKSVLTSPDLGNLPTNQVGSQVTNLMNMLKTSDQSRANSWETKQRQIDLETQKAGNRVDLQTQKEAARMEEIEARKTKLRLIDELEASGKITPERAQQAREMFIGLQPQARNQPNEMEVFEQVTGAPKELRGTPQYEAKYYDYLQKKNPKAFQVNVGGGGGGGGELRPAQAAVISGRLRGEMKNNPYVKNFQDVDSKYKVMIQALEEAPKAGTLVAVDQALISLFNKMTDPQSVVRESEYARTGRDMSLLNKLKGKVEKVMSGGAGLTSEERQALVDMGTKFYNSYAGNYNDAITNMNELSQLEGIDPRRVNTTYRPAKLREEKGPTGGASNQKPITLADINATALKYKMTPAQVKQKLGIR